MVRYLVLLGQTDAKASFLRISFIHSMRKAWRDHRVKQWQGLPAQLW